MSTCVPNFTLLECIECFRSLYDIPHTTITDNVSLLPSYIDQNININNQYVLKVSNQSTPIGVLQMENYIMLQGGKITPKVITSRSGKDIETYNGYHIRLVTFLSGTPAAEHSPYSEELLLNIGREVGTLNKSLVGYDTPAAHRFIRWDLKAAEGMIPMAHFIQDPTRRQSVQQGLMNFAQHVSGKLSGMRQGIIHNDINDYNVLVAGNEVTGILDFGDVVHTPVVCEAAIMCTYFMLGQVERGADPWAPVHTLLKGYTAVFPLLSEELNILPDLIRTRLCCSLSVNGFERSQTTQAENLDYVDISAKPVWALLQVFDMYGKKEWDDIRALLQRYVSQTQTQTTVSILEETMIQQRGQLCSKNLKLQYSKKPLHIVRGSGTYLYDANGVKYLDCVNNVCHVGHCHPSVVSAISSQAQLLNTNTRYLHENLLEAAQEVLSIMPADSKLEVVYLVCTGSEANELAIRLATTFTGRKRMIVLDHAYHGNTSGLVELSPYKYRDQGKRESARAHSTTVLPCPDPYRLTREDLDSLTRAAFESIPSDDLPAALIAESIVGCGGQVVPPPGWLDGVYTYVQTTLGGLCIADEVQTGLGRVGTHMWSYEQHGVRPDIVTIGKPFGNGHPVAAVVTRRDIAECFAKTGIEYFNTFGGNPVSCAAAREVVRIVKRDGLQQHANTVGNYLLANLKTWVGVVFSHDGKEEVKQDGKVVIGDVRGSGLFLGIELVTNLATKEPATQAATEVTMICKESFHVLLSTDGPYDNVLKFKPPMTFSMDDADVTLTAIRTAMIQLQK